MSKKITISGYYGFGNIGDEAVLAGIIASLKLVDVDARITVLSADPARTRAEHPSVESVHRYAIVPVIRAIAGSDLVISGGGSILQDVTSARSVYYYLSVIRFAQFLGRKTMIYAQGIGPLVRTGARKSVAHALGKASAITVRDRDSAELLRSIGVERAITVAADPSFLVEPDIQAADRLLASRGLAGRELMAVSLRPWPGVGDWLTQASETIGRVCEELGATALVIPMQPDEDALACAGVTNGVVIDDSGSMQAAKGIISKCSLCVGMRLHALIFAASEGVPFVPLVYDPKVESFAAMADQPCQVRVGITDQQTLADAIRQAWTNREELTRRLQKKTDQMTDQALSSAKIAREMLSIGVRS